MSCPTCERRASRGSPPRNHRSQPLTAQDFTYNSFVPKVFARIPAIFMKTRNLGDGGRGGGGPTTPTYYCGTILFHRPLLASVEWQRYWNALSAEVWSS
jgi:hypothetical protein